MASASVHGVAKTPDFREEGDAFVASIPATGFETPQLEVEVAGHTVTVRGRGSERTFARELHLPADADPDDLTATLAQGVLQLRARREPPLRRPVPIEIGGTLINAEAAPS
ncbi:MAG: Hsp20/alpha crystallin family protein [Gaiellaceae bacterium]